MRKSEGRRGEGVGCKNRRNPSEHTPPPRKKNKRGHSFPLKIFSDFFYFSFFLRGVLIKIRCCDLLFWLFLVVELC